MRRSAAFVFLGPLFTACQATSGTASAPRTAIAGPALAATAPTLTLEDCFALGPKLRLRTGVSLGWLPDGARYLAVAEDADSKSQRIFVVDAETGARATYFDRDAARAAFANADGVELEIAEAWSRRTSFTFTDDKRGVLLNEEGDLYFWALGAHEAVRLTDDEREEVGETLSPDGKWVAFVADYDLHVVPTDGSAAARALTTDGDEDHLNGRLDWLYQEEVYGRGNFGAFWWSPDSTRIAFLSLDETDVPAYTVVDHREVHPELEEMRYPKAGDPNPRVELAVVDVAGGEPRRFDLTAYPLADRLIVRVGWTPDSSRVVFQVQNRIQTWLDLVVGDPANGAAQAVFRDATPVWIEPVDGFEWLDGGARFLWLSERDGYRHLYLYESSGALVRQLTRGPWEVDEIEHVDEDGGFVYVTCDKDDVKGAQLYRVALADGSLQRVTEGAGSHSVSMSPDGSYFLDTFSSARDWPRLTLHRADGELVREIERVDAKAALEEGIAAPEFIALRTRDGFEMEAMLFKPAGFDPTRRYPVLCHVYSGPHAPKVVDRALGFDALFHSMLAQEGYLVWICDNRSASGKGLASVQGIYRNLGAQELADIEDGLDWLVAQGYADPGRIGIWGWSYGGYQTAYCLTHSKRFKCGIAGAPVTDWRLYDSIYTERYMDTPQANPQGYAASSVLEAAANLHGRLLVIHGTIDENVHMQNTLQLALKLQQAGKQFELMLYPGNRHGVVEPRQRKHLYAMMAQFVRDNL